MACNGAVQSPEDPTFEIDEDQVTFRGTASKYALSATELKTYVSDRQYLRKLAPRGVAVRINHADPRQHNFAVMRMKLAGKTRENSPELFRALDALKASQVSKGMAAGTVEVIAPLVGEITSQHEILATGVNTGNARVVSGAISSRKDTLSYGYVDSGTWDADGNPIGDMSFVEVFGNMRYSVAQSVGDLGLASTTKIEGDSFLSETLAGTGQLVQSYTIAETKDAAEKNALTLPTIEHPRDLDNNGKIVVCLDRTWTGDCDYNNTGFSTLKLPLKGTISVTGLGTTIDWPLIQQYANGTVAAPGKVYATLGTNGGGCVLPPTGAGMTMQSFWQQVSVSPTNNPTNFAWDLHSNLAKWADFSNACRLVQDTVYVTMDIAVPYKNIVTGTKGTLPVTISNATFPRPLEAPSLEFRPAFQVTNSCLAEGTMVAMSEGQARKIEDLSIGDVVSTPYAAGLTVTDTAIGTERNPMVRIVDSRGRSLLMTETHPLYVVDRGMVAAKYLKAGDRVKTDDGSSELVTVARETYTGKVFNLKVGTNEESMSLLADQTAVYANGFLVGDGQIQDKYERLEMKAGDAAKTRLPMSWRTDYLTSLRRSQASQN